MIRIPFNKPPTTGSELTHIQKAISGNKLCGDGKFGVLCQSWFEENTGCEKALLTPSCTHALELAAILADITAGDEVIMPSYTFVSTANAFVLRGAKIVFVDIRPDTMNIDENLIEAAITNRTKAIVPVHYAGVSCEMDTIMALADQYNLLVIEDAAQAVGSFYKGRALGSIGHLGAYSFHETKNYSSGGEGGLLLINDSKFKERAEIIREKGTNRSQFFRGVADKYTWIDIGSSFLPSELQSAYLWAQLLEFHKISSRRKEIWDRYHKELKPLQEKWNIELPKSASNEHNAHMFYIKFNGIEKRGQFIKKMTELGILTAFHYIPLHSSEAGVKYGQFCGEDKFTTVESERLVRLPLFYNMTDDEVNSVIQASNETFASIL